MTAKSRVDIPGARHTATILSDMGTKISALETKLAKYKQVTQGMMQNLLTGKIRLACALCAKN